MKICFCSTFLNDEKDAILNSKIAPSVSTHNFNVNILNGLRENIDDDLTILNTEKLASYPNFNRIIINSSKEKNEKIGSYYNIGKINLPILKDISESIILYYKLNNWIKSNYKNDIYICAYGRRLSHVLVINTLRKRYKKLRSCMVLADLSGNAACKTENYNSIKDKLMNILLDFQVKQSKKFDSFVLLTSQMADYLNIKNKPFTVIEGIYSLKLINDNIDYINCNKQKIVAYSGILSSQYNVDNLLKAFDMIDSDEYELWLFGDGELKEEIMQKSKVNKNIKYFGYIDNNSLKKELNKATLLINPRQNAGEYTKYSFPSKIIEYLTLQKPVVGYKLDGIPNEYDDYIFYIENNSIEALRNKIIEICEYSKSDLKYIGARNLKFILDNKNSISQTRKILDMFSKMKDFNS